MPWPCLLPQWPGYPSENEWINGSCMFARELLIQPLQYYWAKPRNGFSICSLSWVPLEHVSYVMDPFPWRSESLFLNEACDGWSSRRVDYLLDLHDSANRSQEVKKIWYDFLVPLGKHSLDSCRREITKTLHLRIMSLLL